MLYGLDDSVFPKFIPMEHQMVTDDAIFGIENITDDISDITKNPATGQEKSRIFLLAELVKRFVEVLSYVKNESERILVHWL